MHKSFIAIGIFLASIILLFFAARVTGVLEYYTLPTPSNEPSLRQGSIFFASNLKKYKRLDFVCYRHHETNEIYIFRLCGLPGDKVELRNGILFINDQNIDKNLTLMHNYYITPIAYDSLRALGLASEAYEGMESTDYIFTAVVDSAAYHCAGTNFDVGSFLGADFPMIKEKYGQDWTPNNFGPITVPKDSVFVLGDSRDNSMDSRYTGFVAQSAIVSTKL